MTTTRTRDGAAVAVPQLTLPGQAATAEGPLDMTMMYVMHHAFRRDLTDLAAAVAATPLADREVWQALARRWDQLAFALHHHHQGEDAGYWPLLRERVGADDLATLDAMEAEHEAIDPLLEGCGEGFARLARGPSAMERAILAARLRQARGHLDGHLAHEETEAIPLLHRHVTPEEDERIEAEHFRAGASLAAVLRTVPWAAHGLSDDARAHLWRTTGVPFRVLWWLTRRRFERQDRLALRHVEERVRAD